MSEGIIEPAAFLGGVIWDASASLSKISCISCMVLSSSAPTNLVTGVKSAIECSFLLRQLKKNGLACACFSLFVVKAFNSAGVAFGGA